MKDHAHGGVYGDHRDASANSGEGVNPTAICQSTVNPTAVTSQIDMYKKMEMDHGEERMKFWTTSEGINATKS